MKRLLFSLMAFVCLSVYAQKPQHFKFLGIPIDGHHEQFDKSLKQKGFVFMDSIDNAWRYKGKMYNDSVLVNVQHTPKTKTIYNIMMQFFFLSERDCHQFTAQRMVDYERTYKHWDSTGTLISVGTIEETIGYIAATEIHLPEDVVWFSNISFCDAKNQKLKLSEAQ